MCENCEIDTLALVYLTNEQTDELTERLRKERFYFTKIASSGGFISYQNITLLVGINRDRLDALKDIIKECCKRRTTHIATQTHIESYPHHGTPVIVEAEVGGANLHIVTVEHFEQF